MPKSSAGRRSRHALGGVSQRVRRKAADTALVFPAQELSNTFTLLTVELHIGGAVVGSSVGAAHLQCRVIILQVVLGRRLAAADAAAPPLPPVALGWRRLRESSIASHMPAGH